jgi:hypothetical protein
MNTEWACLFFDRCNLSQAIARRFVLDCFQCVSLCTVVAGVLPLLRNVK